MTCTHTQRTPDVYVEDPDLGSYWEYGHEESTTEDIDIGRYRCTQCGQIFYYTGRWREIWEGKAK